MPLTRSWPSERDTRCPKFCFSYALLSPFNIFSSRLVGLFRFWQEAKRWSKASPSLISFTLVLKFSHSRLFFRIALPSDDAEGFSENEIGLCYNHLLCGKHRYLHRSRLHWKNEKNLEVATQLTSRSTKYTVMIPHGSKRKSKQSQFINQRGFSPNKLYWCFSLTNLTYISVIRIGCLAETFFF